MKHSILIRHAVEDDAAALLEHVEALSNEWPNNLFMSPGEMALTEEQERAFIQSHQGGRNLLLVALDDRKVVGSLTMNIMDKRKTRHAAGLGIAIRDGYRSQGIGRRMMEAAIEHAIQHEIHRIGLSVYTRNTAAIKLYESLGFTTEGTKRDAIFEDGEYFDEYYMALLQPQNEKAR